MKRKAASVLLCASLAASLMSGCNKASDSAPADLPTSTAAEQSAEQAAQQSAEQAAESNDSEAVETAENRPAENQQAEEAGEYTISLGSVEDSSDLPDWPGKQLSLTYWAGHGTGGNRVVPRPEHDVVAPEISRVTGVTMDEDNSFDNGGSDYNQKLALIVAGDQWPSLLWNPQNMQELIARDLVYDLTDYLPKYAPDLMEKIPIDQKEYPVIANHAYSGTDRIYGIPYGLQGRNLSLVYPEYDTQFDRLYWGNVDAFRMPIFIRDDVSKMLFPDSASYEETRSEYVKNGSYTMDQIYDIPIHSAQDFYDMLYKIRDLNLDNGSESLPVYASFALSGQDNWAMFAYWLPSIYGADPNFSYYTYFDREANQMSFGYESPLLKQMAYDINKLVRDGVMPKESITDTLDQFQAKLYNGQYAVSYAWWEPDNKTFESNGLPYRYRKAYLKIDVDASKYALFYPLPDVASVLAISKKAVKEEDIPQILQYVNYMVSDVGEKVQNWGPRSAGLFTEQNGERQLTNAAMQDELVSNKPKDTFLDYGLYPLVADLTKIESFMRPSYIHGGNSRFSPDYYYRKSLAARVPEDYARMYNANLVDPYTNAIYARDTAIWNFGTDECPLMNEAWNKRQLVEDSFMKTYTGLTDDQFESAWKNYQDVCRDQVGYNEEAKQQMNDFFFNVYNADYLDVFGK
jgi:hypothetical protein